MPGPNGERDGERPRIRRTALVVTVPAAEPLVTDFRRRFDADSVARQVPTHVTVLFPFVPAAELDAGVRDRVAAHFRAQPAFDASLVGVDRFAEHVWLVPTPRGRFVDLITATCDRFPETSPYEGAFESPEPHLTVGRAGEGLPIAAVTEAAERELAPALPLEFRVEAATLLEEQVDGTWAAADIFPFGR